MKAQLNKEQLLLTLGCICGLANAAGAAESEVVVTATRTNATPAAVTVFNAKNIKTRNTSRLDDALEQVPGLYLCGGALDHEGVI